MRSCAAAPSSWLTPPRSFPDDSFRDDFRLGAASEAAAKDNTTKTAAAAERSGRLFFILPLRHAKQKEKTKDVPSGAADYRLRGGITTRSRNWHMFRIQTKGATNGDGKMSGASSSRSHKQTQGGGNERERGNLHTDTE